MSPRVFGRLASGACCGFGGLSPKGRGGSQLKRRVLDYVLVYTTVLEDIIACYSRVYYNMLVILLWLRFFRRTETLLALVLKSEVAWVMWSQQQIKGCNVPEYDLSKISLTITSITLR